MSSTQLTPTQIKAFQKKILDWYKVHKRDLPWRRTRDPYSILVSEIMLQQTQVSRVIPKYEAWLEKFPTVESLSRAKTSEVLSLWSGLGYNRRALSLKKTAEIIVKECGGKFPKEEKELVKLPGIGKYTARAILCFAFGQQVAVVDTNVRRVILTQVIDRHRERSAAISKKIASPLRGLAMTEKEIQEIADQLLPKGKAYDWNHAMMDYASAVLKSEILQSRTKQAKFIGSNRYYRGQILKVLLKNKKIKIVDLGFKIKEEYSAADEKWLLEIVADLKREGFVAFRKGSLQIAS